MNISTVSNLYLLNDAVMTTDIQHLLLLPWDKCLEVGMSGQTFVNVFKAFDIYCQFALQKGCTTSCSHQQNMRVLVSLPPA